MVSLSIKAISTAFVALLTFGMIACSGVKNEETILFRSEKFGFEAELFESWAGVEGPESIATKTLVGLVAFNSWGKSDFWAREIVTYNPDRTIKSTHYGPEDVASQIPDSEAYVALIQIQGPPYSLGQEPEEYALDDLSGLVDIHDWRHDYGNSAFFREFYKSGETLRLEIFCSQTASDKTVEGLNHLLQSWRFR